MKIALFNPYNVAAPEMPVLALLATYISEYGHEVRSLSCDGCFSICDRRVTPESGLKRRFVECFACMHDAGLAFEKAGLPNDKISSYLTEEDIVSTFAWSQTFPMSSVSDVMIDGEAVLWLCRHSLKSRYGTVEGPLTLPGMEPQLRSLFLSAARMVKVGRRFSENFGPDLTFVSGRDFLAEAFHAGMKQTENKTARFIWDQKTKVLNIVHPVKNEILTLDTTSITPHLIMADSEAWPKEAVELIREIMLFLDIPATQLALFAANN